MIFGPNKLDLKLIQTFDQLIIQKLVQYATILLCLAPVAMHVIGVINHQVAVQLLRIASIDYLDGTTLKIRLLECLVRIS